MSQSFEAVIKVSLQQILNTCVVVAINSRDQKVRPTSCSSGRLRPKPTRFLARQGSLVGNIPSPFQLHPHSKINPFANHTFKPLISYLFFLVVFYLLLGKYSIKVSASQLKLYLHASFFPIYWPLELSGRWRNGGNTLFIVKR